MTPLPFHAVLEKFNGKKAGVFPPFYYFGFLAITAYQS